MSTKAVYSGGVLTWYDGATHERVQRLAPISFSDDFLYPSLVIPDSAALESGVPWAKKIIGAAPPTVAAVANTPNGAVACTLTSASQKQDAELFNGDNLSWSVLQGLVFEARIQLSTLPTTLAQATIGVASAWADGHDAIVYSAFFTARASGELFCDTDDNVTDKDVTSGVTLLSTDWATLRIDMTDPLDIKFYINGARVAAATTFGWAASAANSKVQPFIGMYKASGTGVGTLTADYVRAWQNRS
jgi:hypothetical protein